MVLAIWGASSTIPPSSVSELYSLDVWAFAGRGMVRVEVLLVCSLWPLGKVAVDEVLVDVRKKGLPAAPSVDTVESLSP